MFIICSKADNYYVNRSTNLRSQYVTSSQLLLNFTVDQLRQFKYVNILSVFNDKLLVSCVFNSNLFIFSREGHHLSTIPTDKNDKLRDATWTPRDNIVYAAFNSSKVVVMSKSGKVISTHTHMTKPMYFSVSDDTIYLADLQTGVYKTADDGISWNLIFISTYGRRCFLVIKVKISTEQRDDYWTLEKDKGNNTYLRVYSVNSSYTIMDRKRNDNYVIWRDIKVFTANGLQFTKFEHSCLSRDGTANIFFSDVYKNDFYMLPTNCQYNCQILSSHYVNYTPYRLVVDKERQLMYVGQRYSVVGVLKLTYGDEGN